MMKSAARQRPEPPREAGRPRWSTAESGDSGRGRSAASVSSIPQPCCCAAVALFKVSALSVELNLVVVALKGLPVYGVIA